jgi:hypothetical protein
VEKSMLHPTSRPTLSEWDSVWADFDARRPVVAPVAPVPAGSPRPARPRRLLLQSLAGVLAICIAAPVATALSLAGAVQRLDATAQVDWPTLRNGMRQVLVSDAERHGPMPPFIHAMAATMAERMASPQGLAAVLHDRTGHTQGARLTPRHIVPVGLDHWRVTLASREVGMRDASLTLVLTSELRWSLVGMEMQPR